ncbi:MAG TPA: PH domain-containing protein [Acidimicrobiales bacterium]|nr:PH domain-containing protein [Acidimicrobiales bacterium]
MSGDGTVVVGWQRLHPLSPVVRGARGLVPLVVLVGFSTINRGNHAHGVGPQDLVWLVLVVVGVVFGVVHWLVTRWAFDGATLRIETGLVRRDSQQLPVARIQAVDLVEPFVARVFGLAELRIRVAGAKSAHHLSYLSAPVAADLRARLLATHHGLDQSVPEPGEHPVAVVPPGRLLGSVLVSASTAGAVVFVAALIAVTTVSTTAAAALAGSLLVYLVGIGQGIWRRFNEQYRFTVAVAPDGIRVRRGLLSTVSETIPIRRVQAVRQIEPLWWRLFGWCRLEVDLAGVPGHGRTGGTGRVTKSLLPVGSHQTADYLRRVVVGPIEPPRSRAPTRARLKAPLSYHFLAAGHDETLAVAVTGRVQKVTCWVPLDKAQSIRRVQGPVQRALGLATVHVDVPGRRVGAKFRDRPVDEADRLIEELASHSRGARRRESVAAAVSATSSVTGPPPTFETPGQGGGAPPPSSPPAQPVMGPGWFADPVRRHQARYWNGTAWTPDIADNGVTGLDPL